MIFVYFLHNVHHNEPFLFKHMKGMSVKYLMFILATVHDCILVVKNSDINVRAFAKN